MAVTFRRDPLPGANRWQTTHHRNRIPVPLGLHLDDRESAVVVEKGHPLDEPGEALGKLLFWFRRQSSVILKTIHRQRNDRCRGRCEAADQ